MGDGEINEGQVWESFLLLNKYKLNKVISIIDRNTIQIDGYTEDILPLESLKDKMEAFNFHVIEINGHDFRDIVHAIGTAKSSLDKPTVTSFEGDYRGHGKSPNAEEAKAALKELRSMRGKIKYGED
jgi:transketolase